VRVLIEPTPARVLQWTLYERAQPSPEQVSTLLARLTALMGEGHVGSPKLVNSWKPGAFEITPFAVTTGGQAAETGQGSAGREPEGRSDSSSTARSTPRPPGLLGVPGPLGTAVRRYRMPIPARVQMHDGRPLRVMADRRGVGSGRVAQSAGPWRTSGEWWQDAEAWDRDEWDVVLDGGAAYRIFVERAVGQWFIEAVID
jgi:protein ImuB